MQKNITYILLAILSFFTTACTLSQTSDTASVYRELEQAQSKQNFQKRHISTSSFTLYGLLHAAPKASDTLNVYIEGDGRAWITRYKISANPTPTEATAFHLASHDPSLSSGEASVLYLARPCQYVQGDAAKQCDQKYWTSSRFAPEVIIALSEAIDSIKAEVQAKHVVLIGYSGGGVCAALVAAQRDDVTFLGSVAANLDTESWTRWHKVSPLYGSLNPMQKVKKLRHIPQRHLTSHDDVIVPPSISQNFCNALYKPEYCEQVSGVEHGGAWYTVWNYTYQ